MPLGKGVPIFAYPTSIFELTIAKSDRRQHVVLSMLLVDLKVLVVAASERMVNSALFAGD